MDASMFNNLGKGLVTIAIALFVAGMVIGLALYFLFGWLSAHISIGWS